LPFFFKTIASETEADITTAEMIITFELSNFQIEQMQIAATITIKVIKTELVFIL
jgi:hypothetical protein